MEWTFEVTYSIDVAGMTTRTIVGTIEIPAHRQDRSPSDIADEYRERLVLAVPSGFRRTQQTFSISRDNRTLDFVIVDTEHASENAFPPGVVDADVHYTVQR